MSTRHILTMIALSLATSLTAFGQTDDAEMSEEEKSAKRMEFMEKAISRFHLRFPGDNEVIANVTEKPLLRWANPHSTARDGILTAFVAGGRPMGIVQMALNEGASVIHEFHLLCDRPFELRREETVMWAEKETPHEFLKLDDVEAPRDSKVQRISQMRKLAAEFEVIDNHGFRDKTRHSLRLLTQPVYRYEDEPRHIIDGAVFVFGLGNDPECVLLLEACKDGETSWWQYCLSPVTIYELEASRAGEIVWSVPEKKVFGRGYLTQFVSPYRRAPDDADLKPLMPKKD